MHCEQSADDRRRHFVRIARAREQCQCAAADDAIAAQSSAAHCGQISSRTSSLVTLRFHFDKLHTYFAGAARRMRPIACSSCSSNVRSFLFERVFARPGPTEAVSFTSSIYCHKLSSSSQADLTKPSEMWKSSATRAVRVYSEFRTRTDVCACNPAYGFLRRLQRRIRSLSHDVIIRRFYFVFAMNERFIAGSQLI